MNKRKILKRGKRPIKNRELIGKSWGGGQIKKINGSWSQGVKPKAATKLALKATTSLTKTQLPKGISDMNLKRTSAAFGKTVKTIQKASQPPMRKGMQMLKKKARPIPKNVRPTIKRTGPKR